MARSSWALLVLLTPAVTSAQPAPPGTVLVVATDPDRAVAAASSVGGAEWRGARLDPAMAEPPAPPTAAIDELARLWGEALAQQCLAQVNREALDLDRLLARGHRAAAARVALLGALCLAPFDEAQARERLARAAGRELPLLDAARETNAEVVSQVDEATRDAHAAVPVEVELRSEPAGARVVRDGGAEQCVTPCTMRARPGSHVFVGSQLGRETATIVRDLDARTGAISIALARPRVADARAQLAASVDRVTPEWIRAAAHAYGSTVVVAAWRDGAHATARLYDRRTDALQDAVVDDAIEDAVQAAVNEWWGEVRPEDPGPYIAIGVIAGVLAIGAAVVAVLAATGDLIPGSFTF